VTNIGTRPTVDASGRTTVETHVFDVDRDLYGASLRIGFVQRLRDERRFESLDALREQIAADVRRARVLFGRLSL
jgi:riboflavin kinase/FMN adenylyltransferase